LLFSGYKTVYIKKHQLYIHTLYMTCEKKNKNNPSIPSQPFSLRREKKRNQQRDGHWVVLKILPRQK